MGTLLWLEKIVKTDIQYNIFTDKHLGGYNLLKSLRLLFS